MTAIVNAISAEPIFWLIMAALVVIVAGLGFLSTGTHDYPQRNPDDDLAEYRDHELDVSNLDRLDYTARDDDWLSHPIRQQDVARTRAQESASRTLARCPQCGAWPGQAHGFARPCTKSGAA